jgi:hypothetical protein
VQINAYTHEEWCKRIKYYGELYAVFSNLYTMYKFVKKCNLTELTQ